MVLQPGKMIKVQESNLGSPQSEFSTQKKHLVTLMGKNYLVVLCLSGTMSVFSVDR